MRNAKNNSEEHNLKPAKVLNSINQKIDEIKVLFEDLLEKFRQDVFDRLTHFEEKEKEEERQLQDAFDAIKNARITFLDHDADSTSASKNL